ncbi:MAG TPA: hypothetical protein VLA37_14555 [Sphingomonadaceae bacterium]|nr:hypothetical protein [Sphingomonadaceae bacterium]
MRFRSALTAFFLCAASGCVPSLIKAQEAWPAEILIDGSRIFPESITSDSAGNIYVGSNPGIIYRAPAGEDVASPWILPDAENGLQTVFGVLADEARGLLWACSNPAMGSNTGGPAIKTFALADGGFVASYPFPADAGPAMCNDMTIDKDGDVYASEMLGGRIMLLPNGAEAFESWASDPEFASLDGISFGPGGELYGNAIQRNTLLKIHRNADGSFVRAEVLETSHEMSGPDGLRPLDANRMLQSEGNAGTITVLTFAESGPVQIAVIADGIDYASSVTFANGRAYYPEGKLGFLFGPKAGQDPGPFVIRSAEIPEAQ